MALIPFDLVPAVVFWLKHSWSAAVISVPFILFFWAILILFSRSPPKTIGAFRSVILDHAFHFTLAFAGTGLLLSITSVLFLQNTLLLLLSYLLPFTLLAFAFLKKYRKSWNNADLSVWSALPLLVLALLGWNLTLFANLEALLIIGIIFWDA